MKKHLLLCVEIEETAARIYRQLSNSKHLRGELKVVLQNLADDEDDHASQLRFALRFATGPAFTEKSFDLAPIKALLDRAKALLDKTQQLDFDTRQAIDTGIELEQDFCQVHIDNSLEFKDQSLKRMFAALAQDDRVHSQKLQDAKDRFL